MKKFPKKFFNEIFEQCHSAKKCKKGGPFAIFRHPLWCKISKQIKGGPFAAIQKVSKNLIVPKKSGAMWGFLVCFRGSGRLFCFFFSFWTRF